MALRKIVLTLGLIAAAAPAAAAAVEDRVAPAGSADTRYCMKIELTGSVVQPVKCWTREQWADRGVDVDKDWPREGVRVLG
jgi:hypothetical protein